MKTILAAALVVMTCCPAEGGVARLAQDGGAFLDQQSLFVLAGGLGLAAAARSLDDSALGRLEENPILELTDVTKLYGSSSFNMPAAVLFWS